MTHLPSSGGVSPTPNGSSRQLTIFAITMNAFHAEPLLLQSSIFTCRVPRVYYCAMCGQTINCRFRYLSGLVVHGTRTAPFLIPLRTSSIHSGLRPRYANERKQLITVCGRQDGHTFLRKTSSFFQGVLSPRPQNSGL